MDFREHKQVIQERTRNNLDGSVTIQRRLKPLVKRKVVVARGSGEHTIGAVLASPLIPFRKSMILQLNKRGFDTSKMDFKTLVALYYNEFVSNKENLKSPFVPINTLEFRNNPAFKIKPSDDFNGDLKDFKNADYFNQVNDVTDRIINVFTMARQKRLALKAQGYEPKEMMTDEELLQSYAAGRILGHLESALTNNRPVTTGSLKAIILMLIGVWILFKLFE